MQRQSEDGDLPDIRTIGFFEVNELDAEPTKISSKMGDFLKPIAWKKINQINSGERVKVGQNYKDFYEKNQNAILLNTERIERAVGHFSNLQKLEVGHFKPDSKGKPKIFVRTAVLYELVTAILQPEHDAESKGFEFVFNKDKKELKIWASEFTICDVGFGPFVEKTLTTEKEMPADEVVYYGYQSTYQLTELSYPGFVVYTSKEIDAIDNVKKGGEEFPIYEIKSCFNLKKDWIDYILIKNVAFTDKKVNLIIGELEQQGENQETTVIEKIRIVDNVESLDGSNLVGTYRRTLGKVLDSNLVEACRRELGKVFDSILDLVENSPNGILSVTYQGIQLNGSNGERAIATKSFSPELKNGKPKGHKKNDASFDESDVKYLLDPNYKVKSTWPLRDSQDFKNFLEHGFTNRKKEKYVFVFPKVSYIPPNVQAKLIEEGYDYNKNKTEEQRKLNKNRDALHCFVLKEPQTWKYEFAVLKSEDRASYWRRPFSLKNKK